jgi:hypothetical protein
MYTFLRRKIMATFLRTGRIRAFIFKKYMLFASLLALILFLFSAKGYALNASPPEHPVKLIFIHHSCGENWLSDHHGGLGKALGKNHYFVSDTNYGWGPNGIGDRTDIPNWPEWFVGPDSRRILKALFRENGKHSPYSRTQGDPGGENRVVMFKSCFPNSNLEGRPTDPPRQEGGLTVGHAKAVYNKLLAFFAARPDKLFIAVTAPPVQDPSHSANARAFNKWLTREWLKGYEGSNVGVFDFYNVLTGPRNHHRVEGGRVKHSIQDRRDTLYYPTNGDDHPSPAGNRKATQEFVPLLNAYVNQWLASGPPGPPPETTEEPEETHSPSQELESAAPVKDEPKGTERAVPGLIDGFEKSESSWTAFLDHEKPTRLDFKRDSKTVHSGKASLCITYDVAPESWATCSLVYDRPRDWTAATGLQLFLRTKEPGQPVVVVAYQGTSPDGLSHFEYRLESDGTEWQRVDIPWDRLVRPSWEGDPSTRFDPTRAMGVAFAFEGGSGTLWVDDVTLMGQRE